MKISIGPLLKTMAIALFLFPLGIVRQAIDEVVEVTMRLAQLVHDLVDRERAHGRVDFGLTHDDLGVHVPLLVDPDHLVARVARRKHRPRGIAPEHAIVPADPPGEMHRATPIEIAHFVVRPDMADPGP